MEKLYLIIEGIHSCMPAIRHLGSLCTCRLLSLIHLFSFAGALGDIVKLPTTHGYGRYMGGGKGGTTDPTRLVYKLKI